MAVGLLPGAIVIFEAAVFAAIFFGAKVGAGVIVIGLLSDLIFNCCIAWLVVIFLESSSTLGPTAFIVSLPLIIIGLEITLFGIIDFLGS